MRFKHWKLVLQHTSASYKNETQGKGGFPAKIDQIEVEQALYDLSHDPGERVDIQKLFPEVVEEIMKLVADARSDLGDDLANIEGKNRRKAAVVE